MTSQGLAREVRAGVFTLVCLSVSVALHSWTAGALPSLPSMVAGAGLVLVVAFLLAGRERRFPLIAAVLLGAQAGLHYLFDALPHAHHHDIAVVTGAGPSITAMVLAHLLAGVSTAAWLRGGESAAWQICRWLARSVGPLCRLWTLVRTLVAPVSRPALARMADHPPVRTSADWRHSVIRRGPPVLRAS